MAAIHKPSDKSPKGEVRTMGRYTLRMLFIVNYIQRQAPCLKGPQLAKQASQTRKQVSEI